MSETIDCFQITTAAGEAFAPVDFSVPCLVQMSAEVYFADPCPTPALSQSIAHTLISKNPQHAHLRHPRFGGVERAATKATDRGSLVHTLLLGIGKQFHPIDAPDFRTKAAQQARDKARELGMIPVLESDLYDARAAVEQIRNRLAHDFEEAIVLDGKSEIAAFWHALADDGTRVQCRALLDHLKLNRARAIIYDLKTCRSAHPRACQSHIVEYGYDIQAASNIQAIEAAFPDLAGRVEFVNLFCEIEPPFCVTPITHRGSLRELGQMRWRRALNKWGRCVSANRWPGYVEQITAIEAPQWALSAEIDAEDSDGLPSFASPDGPVRGALGPAPDSNGYDNGIEPSLF